ncbi:hypothetical protein LCGC14_1115910 [marine sediment metagenome]|uniref:Uncharacterized protein n=1 Tax=marine sediment metagenome TaxID=412755 RepID=A0A0F9PNH7_9ZZZZ
MKNRTIKRLETTFKVKLSKSEVREIGLLAFETKESVYVVFTEWVKTVPCKCSHNFDDHETIFEVDGPVNSKCLMENCECEKFKLKISTFQTNENLFAIPGVN